MDEDEELRQIGDADAEAAAMAEFDQGYNAPEEAPAEQLPMPQPVDDGGEAAAYEAFDTSYNAPAEQKAPGRVMSIGGGGKGRKPANPFAPQQGPANQAGRDFNRMNSGVPQQQMQMPPAMQALQQAAASGSFVARRALIQQMARAADQEQHFAMQSQFQAAQLSQSEKMQTARLEQQMAAVDANDGLAPEEKANLKMQLATKLNPYQQRMAAASVLGKELQNKAMIQQAEQQAALKATHDKFMAKTAQDRMQTVQLPGGGTASYVMDEQGKLTQVKDETAVMQAKIQAEQQKAVLQKEQAELKMEMDLRKQITQQLTVKGKDADGNPNVKPADPEEVERQVQKIKDARQMAKDPAGTQQKWAQTAKEQLGGNYAEQARDLLTGGGNMLSGQGGRPPQQAPQGQTPVPPPVQAALQAVGDDPAKVQAIQGLKAFMAPDGKRLKTLAEMTPEEQAQYKRIKATVMGK